MIYQPKDLKNLPTLCTAQCCSLKVQTNEQRVWLCRVAGGVSVETYNGRSWHITSGNCSAPFADTSEVS